ncbi:hypothetical protein JCM10213v2_004346 [Rhodosporidiobolus nylandii]
MAPSSPSSEVDELDESLPAALPAVGTTFHSAGTRSGRGRGAAGAPGKGKAAFGRSSKPATSKGKGKAKQQQGNEEEEEDELADDDSIGQPTAVSSASSSTRAALERFKFKGPKPTPFSDVHSSSSVVPIQGWSSESGEAAGGKKRRRPSKELEEEKPDKEDARPKKRSSPSAAVGASKQVQPQPSKKEQPSLAVKKKKEVFVLPDLDEDGNPIPSSPSSSSDEPEASQKQLSSPFGPPSSSRSQQQMQQSRLSSTLQSPVSYLARLSQHPQHPSQPFSPSGKPLSRPQPSPRGLLQSDPPSHPSSSASQPQHALRAFPSSIELPTQIAARLAAHPSSSSSGVLPRSSTPPAVTMEELNEEVTEGQTRTSQRAPLTDEQKHEVAELLDGLAGDVGGILSEEYIETMVEDAGAAERDKGEGPADLLAPSQLPSAAPSSASSSQQSPRENPFADDLPLPAPRPTGIDKLFSLSPPDAGPAAPADAERVARRSTSLTTSADTSATLASTSAAGAPPQSNGPRPKALFGTAPRDWVPFPRSPSPPSAADIAAEPSAFLAAHLDRARAHAKPKPKTQMRLVPLSVEGVVGHLRELLASSGASTSGGGEDDPQTVYLRGEVKRLTREVLDRDSALSTLHGTLRRVEAERDAALKREEQWEERAVEWEHERERGGRKIEALREVRRGLLEQLEEARARREDEASAEDVQVDARDGRNEQMDVVTEAQNEEMAKEDEEEKNEE